MNKEYPYKDGDFQILGPGIFTRIGDRSVVSIDGENYTPQRLTLRTRLHNFIVRFR